MNVWTYWRCEHCHTILRGDVKKCPNCGGRLMPGQKYLMPNDPVVERAIAKGEVITGEHTVVTEAVTTVSKEDERFDANWVCEYCGQQNSADDTICIGCGSDKTEAGKDYFGNKPHITHKDKDDYKRRTGMDYDEHENVEPVSHNTENKQDEHIVHDIETETPAPQPKRNTRKMFRDMWHAISSWFQDNAVDILPRISIAAVAIALVSFLIWLFTPITRTSTVTGFEWQRNTPIEEFQLCHESDWSMPSGATLEYTQEEIRSYKKVVDHYETKSRQVSEQVFDGYDTDYRDLGNGQAEVVQTPRYRTEYHTETYQVPRYRTEYHTEYYEEPVYRDEPVYDTKYYYTVDRWIHVDTLTTSGRDHTPVWPETGLSNHVDNPDYGDRREGSRFESFWLLITDEEGNEQRVSYTYDKWCEMELHDEISYKTFRFSQKPL